MVKYRMKFPEFKGKDGKVSKPRCLILRDVRVPDTTEKNAAVVVSSPVILTEGYLPVETFPQESWLVSLQKGQVRMLIDQGIIIVEEDIPEKKSEVNISSNQAVPLETKGRDDNKKNQAQVSSGIINVESKFNALSFKDKQSFIKECADSAELEKVLKGDSPNKYFTKMLNKRIRDLSEQK